MPSKISQKLLMIFLVCAQAANAMQNPDPDMKNAMDSTHDAALACGTRFITYTGGGYTFKMHESRKYSSDLWQCVGDIANSATQLHDLSDTSICQNTIKMRVAAWKAQDSATQLYYGLLTSHNQQFLQQLQMSNKTNTAIRPYQRLEE